LADASPKSLRRSADALQRQPEVPPQLALRVGTPIREGLLRKLPDAFVGVELRGIAGEAIEVEPGEEAAHRTDRIPFVNASVVPHQHDRPAEMAEQLAQEGADLGVLDVLRMEGVVEAQATAAGTHRDARDDGDSIAPLPVIEQRRAPARRPRLADARNQEEARFVDEDEVGTQPRGFFLMRGHSCSFQRSMASSLRSSARRSGLWWLKPSA